MQQNKYIAYLLLIEDNPIDALITQTLLKKTGFLVDKTKWVQNGQVALEQLHLDGCEGTCPDLILLDLDMPIVSGLEFLALLSRLPHLSHLLQRIVMLSSSCNVRDQQQALAFKIHRYLTKPLQTDQLQSYLVQLHHSLKNT